VRVGGVLWPAGLRAALSAAFGVDWVHPYEVVLAGCGHR